MNSEIAEKTNPPRRLGRSIAALLAGFGVNLALTLPTDFGLHAVGVFPALGQPMNDSQSALATAYRALYSVISSYAVARFAPYRPMEHALIGAAIGMSLATLGAVATWNQGLGPRWYSLALIVLALPTGWLGGKLRLMQMQRNLG
jgi:hypothetical protein